MIFPLFALLSGTGGSKAHFSTEKFDQNSACRKTVVSVSLIYDYFKIIPGEIPTQILVYASNHRNNI